LNIMLRKDFLAATLLAGVMRAQEGQSRQEPPVPARKPKAVTKLFKSPEGYPNGLEATNEGLWIAEEVSERANLVDWQGKVLHKVDTESHNVSGIAVGGGYLWMACNGMGWAAPRDPPTGPVAKFCSAT
jgi:hypothetical protein